MNERKVNKIVTQIVITKYVQIYFKRPIINVY